MVNRFTANGTNKLYDWLYDYWVGDGLRAGAGASTAKSEYNSISGKKDPLVTGQFAGGSLIHGKTGYHIGAFSVTQSNGQVVNYAYVRPDAGSAPKGFRLGSMDATIDEDMLRLTINSCNGWSDSYDYVYHIPAGTLVIRSSPSGARVQVR